MSKQFVIALSVLIGAVLIWGSVFPTGSIGAARAAGQDASELVPTLTSYQILLREQPVDSLIPGAKAKKYRIVLTGSAFMTGTVAVVDGADVFTSVDSDTQLTVMLPRGRVPDTGLLSVQARNPNGQLSNQLMVGSQLAGLGKLEHFVFIMQENRSFDSYFGTYPGADGIPAGVCLQGTNGGPCVAPFHDTNNVNRGGPHGWDNALADIGNGRMDGFLVESYKGRDNTGKGPCQPPNSELHSRARPPRRHGVARLSRNSQLLGLR